MISYAEQADEEYGRRLREGLEQARNGRKDSGTGHGPLGNEHSDEAVQKAIDESRETGPL